MGIKVNKLGDDKGVGEVVGVGRQWIGWNTTLYTFPTFKQMKSYEDAFNFQMSDGTAIGYHIGVTYKVDPTKVTTIFQTYRKGVDDITETDLKQKIADVLIKQASRMTTDRFIDGGKTELLDNSLKAIQTEMGPVGIQVLSLSWMGKPEYPPSVIESINAKVTANQTTLQREQQVKQKKLKQTWFALRQRVKLTPRKLWLRLMLNLSASAARLSARTRKLCSWRPSISGMAPYRSI